MKNRLKITWEPDADIYINVCIRKGDNYLGVCRLPGSSNIDDVFETLSVLHYYYQQILYVDFGTHTSMFNKEGWLE